MRLPLFRSSNLSLAILLPVESASFVNYITL